eukprot:2256913-Amphidinium_carterae.1
MSGPVVPFQMIKSFCGSCGRHSVEVPLVWKQQCCTVTLMMAAVCYTIHFHTALAVSAVVSLRVVLESMLYRKVFLLMCPAFAPWA